MSDIDALAAALAPYIQQAVSAAVTEASRRLSPAAPLVGTVASVQGANVEVAVPGQVEHSLAISANAALVAGDQVVVLFFPGGLAYAFGPMVGA